jgi:hypothetical protein
MMYGASGDECRNLLGQEYNRPRGRSVEKAPGSDFIFYLMDHKINKTFFKQEKWLLFVDIDCV